MKTILAMLFSSATFCAMAQDTTILRLEYFIDADPGIGNATSMNIPASEDVSFPFTVNLTGYSNGYHKLYIRTLDNLGRWSLTVRRNIEVLPSSTLNNVVGGEYFIDEDPGFGAGTPINVASPDATILQNFNAILTGLEVGYHKLYGRFRDSYGNWSLTFRRNIEVIKDDNNKIVNGEYFFKTDNGFGECTPVIFDIPSTDGAFSFNISAAQIPADADTIFVRVRDDIQSRWSMTRYEKASTVLPLTLLNFTAVKKLNAVGLEWQTTNEINTAYFNVQRSSDALHFTTVGLVKANNVSGLNNYFYPDNIEGIVSKKLYYRLMQVDIDANNKYSEIVAVNLDNSKTGTRLYPNPAHQYVSIISGIPQELKGAVITVVDVAGKMVIRQSLSAIGQQQINVSGLAKGMYIVHISKTSGKETFKLIKE